MLEIVKVVEKSQNVKTGLVSATYAPLITCSDKCPFKKGGCYGQDSFCGIHLRKLDQAVCEKGISNCDQVAKVEADAISTLSGRYPLRLHVVGDCRTTKSAKHLAKAAEKYGNVIWTYTHSWRNIKREAWGDISILASCETKEQCEKAYQRGYAPCLVVPEVFEGTIETNGLKYKMCLEQTRGIKCVKCKLCFNERKLYEKKTVICFAAHGTKQNEVKKKVKF